MLTKLSWLVFEIQNWLDLFSVCVCVLEIHVLKILNWETILRDFCVDWIIGWVVCWIAFIFVFFTSRKTVLKSCLNNSSIPCYLLSFLSIFFKCNLDTSLIPGGSIEKAPASSIAPRHLLDQSRFFLDSDFLLHDTCSIPQLSTSIFSTPTSTASSTPLDTSSVEHYWRFYLNLLVRSDPYFTRYLSWLLSVFSPKLSHLTPISILKGFFKIFQDFFLLVSF